jgi:hypothetical protein
MYDDQEMISKMMEMGANAYLTKTTDPEEKEVRQAAQMQLADMNLSEAESRPDVFRVVENEIIPQYQNAILFSPGTPVAAKAQEKIISLQKKYELVLFQLSNGRPTLIPPYFLRAAQEVAVDSNVTFSPTETTIAIIETYSKLKQFSKAIQSISVNQNENSKKDLMQKGNELLTEILEEEMPIDETETSIEFNFALLKLKHTVKRKK